MCRLDGRIRSKEDREKIIQKFSKDTSFSSFLLTTQVVISLVFSPVAYRKLLVYIKHDQSLC
jgi:hypothetical protein